MDLSTNSFRSAVRPRVPAGPAVRSVRYAADIDEITACWRLIDWFVHWLTVEASNELPCSSLRHTKLTSSAGYLASVQPDTVTSRFNSATVSGTCK